MMNLLKVINQNIQECGNAEYKYLNPKEDTDGNKLYRLEKPLDSGSQHEDYFSLIA